MTPDGRDAIDRFLETALRIFPSLDPETEAAVDRMVKVVKHLDRVTDHTAGRFGLNTGEFKVLLKLVQVPDQRLTAGALSGMLSLSTGAMTNRLDRLEEAGFAARERDTNDRRSVVVALTPEGREVLDKAVEAQAEEERQLLAALTPAELHRLNALLRKLVLAIEATGAAREPGPPSGTRDGSG
jgi:DNA-binding MarR family transcriptional regulator